MCYAWKESLRDMPNTEVCERQTADLRGCSKAAADKCILAAEVLQMNTVDEEITAYIK